MTHTELQPAEKAVILQEWELEARLTDVAIDEGMTSKGDDGSNKVPVKSLLPEVKKAQQDLGAKPIPPRAPRQRRYGSSPIAPEGAHPLVFMPDYPP